VGGFTTNSKPIVKRYAPTNDVICYFLYVAAGLVDSQFLPKNKITNVFDTPSVPKYKMF
jgi:hypothetical protein